MPFLRFSRDKRGYANTYLCHTFRQDGIVRMRVLYWFRTPPDIEVGRPALDDDAIRGIEKSNPDLTFDWEEILKAKPLPPARDDTDEGRPRRRSRRGSREESTGGRGTAAESTGAQQPAPRRDEPRPGDLDAPPGEPGSGAGERAAASADTAETPRDPPSRRRRRRRRRGRRSGDEGAAPAESGGSAEGASPVEPDADRG